MALADEEPLVRGHAAWALGRIGTEAARQALRGRDGVEGEAWVREEIEAALNERWPPMREIRCRDKLIGELAKDEAMEKIPRNQ
jgi:HEAT repeat protein